MLRATEIGSPNWPVLGILLLALGVVLVILLLAAVRWVVQQTMDEHYAESADAIRQRAQAEYQRIFERERGLNEQSRETIDEMRTLIAEFREVVGYIGQMHPEGWEVQAAPLDQRLAHLDSKLVSKRAVLESAAA